MARKGRQRPRSGKLDGHFYVVGIVGSAGGLEAFREFLRNTPPGSGAAYVIVSHLDPGKESLLTPLLTETTRMRMHSIEEEMTVLPDNVYVIPKGSYLTIQLGKFKLSEMPRYYGSDMPIDHFFKSMADDYKEMAIGVVLSGMGMDGTLGLRAIKNGMGLTIAQDPGTSAYDSMPLNAIDFGVVDVIAPVEQLPDKIMSYINGAPKSSLAPGSLMPRSSLDKVVTIMRNHTGNDFSSYKTDVLERRVSRRMGVNSIKTLPEYASYIENNPKEVALLFKDMLIEVTSFFRDPLAFEELKKVLNNTVVQMTGGSLLKAWVPACLTGEEAYSIAILIDECLEEQKKELKVQIFATDINTDALDRRAWPCTR